MRMKGATLAAMGALSLMTACSTPKPKQFDRWTRVAGPMVSSPETTDPQAAAALCLRDVSEQRRPDLQGTDSWPTRPRLEACMRRMGFSLVPGMTAKPAS